VLTPAHQTGLLADLLPPAEPPKCWGAERSAGAHMMAFVVWTQNEARSVTPKVRGRAQVTGKGKWRSVNDRGSGRVLKYFLSNGSLIQADTSYSVVRGQRPALAQPDQTATPQSSSI
jgi:hypothetical protein